jgi:hypothetical protein
MNPILRRRTWLLLMLVACGEEECTMTEPVRDSSNPRQPPPSGPLAIAPRDGGGDPYRTLVGDSVVIEAWRLGQRGPLPPELYAWTSSVSTVARVEPTGLVIATGPGTTQIAARFSTAAPDLPPAATLGVTVVPVSALATISVLPDSTALTPGQHARLRVSAADVDGHPLALQAHCSSSDPAVAEVDSSGIGSKCRVKAGTPGRAIISVAINAGRSVPATITVRAAP